MIANFLAAAIVTIVAIRGQSQLFWLFPSMISFFYILPERPAGVICGIAISLIGIILFPITGVVEFLTMMFTLVLTAVFSYVIFSNNHKTNEKLTLLARVDPLTAAGNRRALDTKLADVLADQQRQASTMSLLLLDLDLFKKINDEHGHAAGDQILVEAASLLKQHTRALDAVYRYGGEEFIIVPLKADLAAARIIAEKLRSIIANHKYITDIALTVSVGVAQYRAGETAESWIARADAALYIAKATGRNCVITETEIGAEIPHPA